MAALRFIVGFDFEKYGIEIRVRRSTDAEPLVVPAKVLTKKDMEAFPYGKFRFEATVWLSTPGGQEGNSAWTITEPVLHFIRSKLKSYLDAWQDDPNHVLIVTKEETQKGEINRALQAQYTIPSSAAPFGQGKGLRDTSVASAAWNPQSEPPGFSRLAGSLAAEPSSALCIVEGFSETIAGRRSPPRHKGCPSPLGSRR